MEGNVEKSGSRVIDFFIGLGAGIVNIIVGGFLTTFSVVLCDELNLDEISFFIVGLGIPIIFISLAVFTMIKFFKSNRKMVAWGIFVTLLLPILLIVFIIFILLSG